jgi:hypothetical protein
MEAFSEGQYFVFVFWELPLKRREVKELTGKLITYYQYQFDKVGCFLFSSIIYAHEWAASCNLTTHLRQLVKCMILPN